MSDRKDAILSMKALFAVVKCYTLLFDSLSSVGKQYGMSVNEIESYGMSHMDTVDDLVSAMPPRIGTYLSVSPMPWRYLTTV